MWAQTPTDNAEPGSHSLPGQGILIGKNLKTVRKLLGVAALVKMHGPFNFSGYFSTC